MAEFSNDGAKGLGKIRTVGKPPDDRGKPPDDRGKPPDDRGRDGAPGIPCGTGAAQGVFASSCTREAGVVVRASVEAHGPVGDTELTVNVKWPAASIGYGTRGSGPSQSAAPATRASRFGGPQVLLARRAPKPPVLTPGEDAQDSSAEGAHEKSQAEEEKRHHEDTKKKP